MKNTYESHIYTYIDTDKNIELFPCGVTIIWKFLICVNYKVE